MIIKQYSKIKTVSQLRWLCRRGMLELDLLLVQFLDNCFSMLTPEEQALFQALLACSDPDLFAWLLKKQPSSYPQFEPLLQKIREYKPCAFV